MISLELFFAVLLLLTLLAREGQQKLVGINATVVGLLIAVFYDPVWSSGILSAGDLILALAAFGLLALWQLPPWMVVGATGVGGALLTHYLISLSAGRTEIADFNSQK